MARDQAKIDTDDRLESLLERFSVSAQMFHSGPLCGITEFPRNGEFGQLHVVKGGRVAVQHERKQVSIEVPSIVFYPRPMRHRFVTDKRAGADMTCANVAFNAGSINPIAQALPPVVILPLDELDDASLVLDALFREAFAQRGGRQQVVNRLFEVVIVLILRTLLNRASVDSGLLAGMADPQIAKALIAMHAAPGQAWSIEQLAKKAGMSRSRFAEAFPGRVGVTPMEYLVRYRISIAEDLLRKGQSMKVVATQVGYGSVAALSRAFTSTRGQSARDWKRSLKVAAPAKHGVHSSAT
jgi:AraC-like DNA-binding protein